MKNLNWIVTAALLAALGLSLQTIRAHAADTNGTDQEMASDVQDRNDQEQEIFDFVGSGDIDSSEQGAKAPFVCVYTSADRPFRGYGISRRLARRRAATKCQDESESGTPGVPAHNVCVFRGCWMN